MTHRIHLEAPKGADCFRVSNGKVVYYMLGMNNKVYRWDSFGWLLVNGITASQFVRLPGTHRLHAELLVLASMVFMSVVVMMLI